jgi:hypothetical protein
LRAKEHRLDLGIVDVRLIAAPGGLELESRPSEERNGGFLLL